VKFSKQIKSHEGDVNLPTAEEHDRLTKQASLESFTRNGTTECGLRSEAVVVVTKSASSMSQDTRARRVFLLMSSGVCFSPFSLDMLHSFGVFRRGYRHPCMAWLAQLVIRCRRFTGL
jgi:hypothetical protein